MDYMDYLEDRAMSHFDEMEDCNCYDEEDYEPDENGEEDEDEVEVEVDIENPEVILLGDEFVSFW